jgi:hypothetical protein
MCAIKFFQAEAYILCLAVALEERKRLPKYEESKMVPFGLLVPPKRPPTM